MTDYPYMISNNKISPIVTALQSAAKPSRFTLEFLQNLGFRSTNDRAIIPLFKKLGFLSEDSVPTHHYDKLRDPTLYKQILATRIKELYSELFTVNTQIYKESEENVKGAISRVTGLDEKGVNRIYNTFKTLCSIADFNQISNNDTPNEEEEVILESQKVNNPKINPDFHYNIQIHLPATTDISVYNAIFKSLKDNLLI